MLPDVRQVEKLRRELAQVETVVRSRARTEAIRLADEERRAMSEARSECLRLERIRLRATLRLKEIESGQAERFSGEAKLAYMALSDVEQWESQLSAAFTIIAFANLRDRWRYLKRGSEREAVIREAVERGGVYTERNFFQEIVR